MKSNRDKEGETIKTKTTVEQKSLSTARRNYFENNKLIDPLSWGEIEKFPSRIHEARPE